MDSILSEIVECMIAPVGRLLGRQLCYVIHCKTNLKNLRAKVEELKATKQATDNEVTEAERKGEKIQTDVQLWQEKVGQITAQTDELLNDESQAKLNCLYGFCPNLTIRYKLGMKSTELAQEVDEYCEKRQRISRVSYRNHQDMAWAVTPGDYQALESRMLVEKEIMDALKDSKIQRIGVYGIGGVGKTTLVKEVYRKAVKEKMLFDNVVIILDVNSNPDREAIQKKIVDQLGMDILQTEAMDGRASRLYNRIQGKKILVILDGVQEKIELENLGLPPLSTCKILLTCRTRDVLSLEKMHADKVFQLDLLSEEETWSLFAKMADNIINTDIRVVAMQVATKCGGLPLLIVTVASALKEKKLHAWKDALRQLKGFEKEDSMEKAYLTLEWSYDQLNNKDHKQLFLLCGIIARRNHIHVLELLKYGMGLRLFTNIKTVEEAQNKLGTLLDKLKDFCLLLDSETNGSVRMHDLVYHVAKRIAYRDQHVLSVEYGGELEEWPRKDFLKNCTKISLMLSVVPRLSEISLECPELEMFYLHSTVNKRVGIPSEFFRDMQKLKVLGLTNIRMQSLPLSLQCLKKLQTLCLDQCMLGDVTLLGQLSSLEILSFSGSDLKQLPKEIGQLTCLRLLDLSDCHQLEVISPTVISRLVGLEDLRMRNSFNKWEVEGEGSNASILELKHLSQLSALEIHIPNAGILPTSKLERFNIYIGDALVMRYPWEKPMTATSLKTLKLKLTKELDESLKLLLKRSQDLSLDETEVAVIHQLNIEDLKNLQNLHHLKLQHCNDTDIFTRKFEFPNLATLKVHGCEKLRFLFSFSTAKKSLGQLTHLEISSCQLLQEIVSSTREFGEDNMDYRFSKLKVLKLENLPRFTRFSVGNYIEFSALEELKIEACYKLVGFIGDKVAMSSKNTRMIRKNKAIEPRISKEEENLDVKSESTVQNFLFDEKVGFPRLEILSISGIRELKAIWHVQLAQDAFWRLRQVTVYECKNLMSFFPPSVMGRLNALETLVISKCESLQVVFELLGRSNVKETHVRTSSPHDLLQSFFCQNLGSVTIEECHSLKSIFPASVARGHDLQQLTELSVSLCKGIEEIVGEDDEEGAPPHFEFPKVTSVKLNDLPKLTSFYPGIRTSHWPLLNQLEMLRCCNVGIFAAEFSMEHEMECPDVQHPLFLIDKDSFPNLEHLELNDMEIWTGPTPADQLVLDKLKSISFVGNCTPFSKQDSVFFLQGLQILEEIQVRDSDCKEIFVNQGISSSSSSSSWEERHDDAVGSGTLPQVKILSLYRMNKVMHLGNGDSQSVLFPNLEILKVELCSRLKSLESSAIFFHNLTTLEVSGCNEMEYITTYSVAKSFEQLKTLKVDNCESVVVIVESDGDDENPDAEGNEIPFIPLKHLELTRLPRLEGFCSENCKVKFPSSMTLQVEKCPIKLISSNGILLPDGDNQYEQNRVDYDDDEEEEVQTVNCYPQNISSFQCLTLFTIFSILVSK